MKKLVIKSDFNDCINRILECKDSTIPTWFLTKEITLNNNNNKDEIIELLNTCSSFSIVDNSINFKVKRSQSEIDRYHEEKAQLLKYNLLKLKKWFDKNIENRDQIKTYLKAKQLDWILDSINSKQP